LKADGSFDYFSDANDVTADDTDSFVYTIKDGDGDLSTTTLTINVKNFTVTTEVDVDGDASDTSVEEAALAVGSDPDSPDEVAEGSLTADGGTGPYTYELVTDTAPHYGTMVIQPDGTYKYTLTDVTNDEAGPETDTFTYKATDANGNTATSTISIDIVDDVPTAYPGSANVDEGAKTSGNVLTDGTTDDEFGADGEATTTPAGGVVGVAAGSDTSTDLEVGVDTKIDGDHGYLILKADGSFDYFSDANDVTADDTDSFVYTIKDGDGDLSTTTLTINVKNFTVTTEVDVDGDASDTSVEEAALAVGSDPDSPDEVAEGSLTADGGTGPYTYELVTDTAPHYGTMVIQPDGTYKYTLTDVTNDEAGPETDTFTYKATDANGNTATSTISIDIVDDVPTAVDDYATVNKGSADPTNLMMVIDVSGSMGDPVTYDGESMTRLEATKLAAIDLLNSYDDISETAVRLIQFSGSNDSSDTGDALALGSGWVTVTEAISLVEGLQVAESPNFYTNYDAALDVAQDAFADTGKLDGAQNVSYFLSDGVPTTGSGESGTGLSGGDGIGPDLGDPNNEEAVWKGFLNTNDIVSYAIGVGTGATQSALDPVAWDGKTESQLDGIVVTQENELSDVLQSTVVTPPTSGNVLTNGFSGADGWGDPTLVSIEF